MIDANDDCRCVTSLPQACVPAVPSLENCRSGNHLKEMELVLSWERVVAIADAMDFPV
jgi:adenine deaminase